MADYVMILDSDTGLPVMPPVFDFDDKWGVVGCNERSITVPCHFPTLDKNLMFVFSFWINTYDPNTHTYTRAPADSPLYDTLQFALCKQTVSGVTSIWLAWRTTGYMSNIQIEYGYGYLNEDGSIKDNIYNSPSAYETVNVLDGDWQRIQNLSTSGDRADTASALINNKYGHDEGITKYGLEVLEPPIEVESDSLEYFDYMDSISVNGVLVDPTSYGPTSGPGGGTGGTFDTSSDVIGIPDLPTGGAAASGMITMFNPSTAQLQAFGQFLWTSLFDPGYDALLTSLKKWVNDPIESVIQLSCFPVVPPSGAAQTVKFCGISSDLVGAGVSMNKCTDQYTSFDFGYLRVPEFWSRALDYTPYTKVSIYLPYIGICPLDTDIIINSTLHLVYHIDLLTGGFSAFLEVIKNVGGTNLSAVCYNWSGNMATQIPITSANFSQVFGSMMTAVAAIGVGAVTGGLGAAAAGTEAGTAAVAGGALSGAGHGLAANVGNVINSKPHVTKSGRLDGTVGALSVPEAYLILERPIQSLSAKFQEEQGYPSNIVEKLNNLSGLTVCEAPIMSGFSGATEEEKSAIRAMLCEGVIL